MTFTGGAVQGLRYWVLQPLVVRDAAVAAEVVAGESGASSRCCHTHTCIIITTTSNWSHLLCAPPQPARSNACGLLTSPGNIMRAGAPAA